MRPYLFVELTVAEQNEVLFRGWPRGSDIRYYVKPTAGQRGWQLERWTRV